MKPQEIADLRDRLPEEMPFNYYPDRESLWLLSELMPERAPIRDLRAGPMAKLLDRPSVKPAVAACGGILSRDDIRMAGLAEIDMDAHGRVANLTQENMACEGFRSYLLSLSEWATDPCCPGCDQVSRPGGNLVLQVNFPTVHERLFYAYMDKDARKMLEFYSHPVRHKGSPTMGWVRIDIDPATGVALIEEVQSDWFRTLQAYTLHQQQGRKVSRELRNRQRYAAEVKVQYGRDWSRVCLLAALWFLRNECGVDDVFMHRPDTGVRLKCIDPDYGPPTSLYTSLPKAFCFEPTHEVPAFLRKPCSKHLRALRRSGQPLFWRLRF